jgi:hypothetical protein
MGRRWPWLAAAAVLLAVGMWLWRTPDSRQLPARPTVEIPRHLRPAEQQRMVARLRPVERGDAGPGQPLPPPRDPLLSALSAGASQSAVVLEVNALRYSPVGALLLDCLTSREGRPSPVEALRRMGIDPLQDLDRVGMTDHGFMVSGDFRRADWEALLGGGQPTPYGQHGQISVLQAGGDGRNGLYATRWGDSMLHLGTSLQDAHEVIDALEGRGSQRPPVLTPDQTYGELYGVISAQDLARTVGEGDAWSSALAEAASRVELHLDARQDVALVADVSGDDRGKLEDLAKTLGGALALARLKARSEGDAETAELLDFAQVQPPGGRTMSVELALPLEVVARRLAVCRAPPDAGPGR